MHQTKQNAPRGGGKSCALSPRETRALVALMHAPAWISREAIDRISRSSNGPAVVQTLRKKLGDYDAIEMQRVTVLDADGSPSNPGRYRLSKEGRARAVALLEKQNGATDSSCHKAECGGARL